MGHKRQSCSVDAKGILSHVEAGSLTIAELIKVAEMYAPLAVADCCNPAW
jgi:hypothetical protein